MIRIIYNLETKEIITITQTDAVTAFDVTSNGVLQGDVENVVEQILTLSINDTTLFEYIEQNNIQLNMSDTKKQVLKDRSFGQKVLNEFLSENKNIDLTLEQDLQILQAFSPIKAMLEIGAINRAYELWQTVQINDIVTQERKDKYNLMLSQYLNIVI